MNIIRYISLPFFIFAMTEVIAQPITQPFDMEVTSSMLEWRVVNEQINSISKSNAYNKWKKEFAEESVAYAELDVDGDGRKEIIVAGSSFPLRGRGHIILRKNGKKLMNVAQFRGGFIFHKEDKNKKKYSLHVLEKLDGNMYYQVLNLSNGIYKIKSSTHLPRTIYNAEFYDRWVVLNYNEKFSPKMNLR
jgi:hypothetical protein